MSQFIVSHQYPAYRIFCIVVLEKKCLPTTPPCSCCKIMDTYVTKKKGCTIWPNTLSTHQSFTKPKLLRSRNWFAAPELPSLSDSAQDSSYAHTWILTHRQSSFLRHSLLWSESSELAFHLQDVQRLIAFNS